MISNKQMNVRKRVNKTEKAIPEALLHAAFFNWAAAHPSDRALRWNAATAEYHDVSYGELSRAALQCANLLEKNGVQKGDNVGISMAKGPHQIIGVLGILAAGAVYVPIGQYQPQHRREMICRTADIRAVLTEKSNLQEMPAGVHPVFVEDADTLPPLTSFRPVPVWNNAYIIFTSGTTGTPKGVEISHAAAHNTIFDINDRFHVSKTDAILAVSELDFDLSVYDIFGLLSVGGMVRLLSDDTRKEAGIWQKMMAADQITLWNSVPAFFEMLLIRQGEMPFPPSLRLILLSGDRIRPELFTQLRKLHENCQFVALGGATEASIWSNYFIVEQVSDTWKLIPYGYPLSNQQYRIVDNEGNDCADFTPGNIQIGGKGLARQYCNDPDLTSKKFILDGKTRWYDTGDIGQYWEDGCIEYLGRRDEQVKLHGFRIELGEIEQQLIRYDGISDATAVIVEEGGSPYLAAAITPQTTAGVPSHIDEPLSVDMQDRLKEQRYAVAAVLCKVLELERLLPQSADALCTKLGIDPTKQPLFHLWMNWLQREDIIVCTEDMIEEGSCFTDCFMQTPMTEKLLPESGMLQQILRGELQELELLRTTAFAPENLLFLDTGMVKAVTLVADNLNEAANRTDGTVSVAFLKSGTGIFAEKVIAALESPKFSVSLIDTPAMNHKAGERLSGSSVLCQYETLSETMLDSTLQYQFDRVIAVNALHTYPDVHTGITTIEQLLRSDGQAMVVEITPFPHLSLITAAVLENGLTAYTDKTRPEAGNPMLNRAEWMQLFTESGFTNIRQEAVPATLASFFCMDCPENRPDLRESSISRFLAGVLPPYMLPSHLITLFELPLTANGKIDRREITQRCARSQIVDHPVPTEKAASFTETEQLIADLWKEILGDCDITGQHTFFELGGDSLLATHFTKLLKDRFGISLTLKELFEHPSLSEISRIAESRREAACELVENIEEGEI